MSSRRRLRHAPPVKRRSRRDVVVAIGASVVAVAATAFAIWMLRPGGIADRQPRATWFVALVVLAVVSTVWFVLRPRSKRRDRPVPWLVGGAAVIAVAAVVGGIVWPGGLLRHTPRDPFAPTPGDIIIDGDGDGGTTTPPTTASATPTTAVTSTPPSTSASSEPTATTSP
ncbi:MAG TPA: hypothetical protein VFZ83_05440 [Acidimicrobiia bacterium]|nr:hypothetical protein [Acidimicrobiia bacterium]